MCRGRMGPKEHCCIGPIPFWCYFTPFYATFHLKFWFFRTQNQHHWIWQASNPINAPLKPFECIFLSQNQQNVNFLAVCLTPQQKLKNHFSQGQSVQNALTLCTCRCLGVLIAMHYVRTLCDRYFLSYDGFSWFLMGRFRHRVLKCCVGVEWDPRSIAV